MISHELLPTDGIPLAADEKDIDDTECKRMNVKASRRTYACARRILKSSAKRVRMSDLSRQTVHTTSVSQSPEYFNGQFELPISITFFSSNALDNHLS